MGTEGARRGRWIRRSTLAGAAVLAVAVVGAGCSSSSKPSSSNTTTGASPTTAASGSSATTAAAAGNTASAPGISPTTIKVALVTSLSGSDSSNSVNIPKGFAARIAAQNAAGGVDGRKLTYFVEDDQSSPTTALAAAQAAVNKDAFAIDYNSPFAFGAIKYMATSGIPVVGGGYDGPEWTMPSTFPNMFSWAPEVWASNPVWTTGAAFIKSEGGTRIASVGYAISPSSTAAAKGMAPAAQAVGISAPYINTSLPFGTVDVTSIALQMKSENIDAMYGPIDPNTLLAILTAAKDAGLNIKVPNLATGYGEDFLTDPASLQAAQGAYMITNAQVPVELNTPATMTEQAAFAKYENFTGIPDFGWTQGYISADLMIKGLEVAGQNPTRQSFIGNLRKVTDYNAEGLSYITANYSNENPPQTQCAYYVKLVGKQFIVQNNNKEVCGTLIPGAS
jgi:branched-chain amino acid transport system substrate-binding protein